MMVTADISHDFNPMLQDTPAYAASASRTALMNAVATREGG